MSKKATVIAVVNTQLFNLLCEKADDVYGGNIEQFLSRRLKLKAGDEFVVVDAD